MSTKASSISPRRDKILRALRDAGHALQIREIVDRTGIDYNNARTALSEMTMQKLLARVHRGVYDLPERVSEADSPSSSETLMKILQNQQILNVLLNTIITNKALMETLLRGQQEIIRTLRLLRAADKEGQDAIENLEQAFAERVEWHFDIAAQQVVEQYTKLPPEVLDVLVTPLMRNVGELEEQGRRKTADVKRRRSRRSTRN